MLGEVMDALAELEKQEAALRLAQRLFNSPSLNCMKPTPTSNRVARRGSWVCGSFPSAAVAGRAST